MSMAIPGDNTQRSASTEALQELRRDLPGPDNPLMLIPYPLDTRLIQADGRRALVGAEDSSQPLGRVASALAHWNGYLAQHDQRDLAAFLEGAQWLVSNEAAIGPGLGGWPVRAIVAQQPGQRGTSGIAVLSARMQGLALSALARAYYVTGDDAYSRCATRALRTFAHDILDGGIATPIADDGVGFEDVGMYPASHTLSAFLLGITSLYDYGALRADPEEPETLARRGHNALHALVDAYDTGYWTRADLLGNTLATWDSQRLCAQMLNMVATCAKCDVCQQAAKRWGSYSQSPAKRVQARVVQVRQAVGWTLWRSTGALCGLASRKAADHVRGADSLTDSRLGICVPITAYPVSGGMRAVLDGWRSAMSDDWTMEFLTAHIGPDAGDRIIRRFGSDSRLFGPATYTPFRFPNVLAYVGLGTLGLHRLLRQRPGFSVILPQDGLYSAVFASILAKLAGIRCVVVDHGNIHDAFDPAFYTEKREPIARRRGLRRWLGLMRLVLYLRTMRWLAKIGTRWSDHILVASDDIARAYRQHLRVPSHHITRFPFMLDVTSSGSPDDDTTCRHLRAELKLPADAIIVTIISRLHPMKGVDTGISAIERTYDALPPTIRKRLYVLIAGDGELREQVTEQIRNSRLAEQIRLWGDATAGEVAMLLKASDIFLYPARRGINSMAVLEAMGAGCATVATVTSPHIAEYLDEDRGCAVPIEDVDALADSLKLLIANDERRREIGRRAHAYVMQHHTAAAVRRYLLRATYWVPTFLGLAAAADQGTLLVVPDEKGRTR